MLVESTALPGHHHHVQGRFSDVIAGHDRYWETLSAGTGSALEVKTRKTVKTPAKRQDLAKFTRALTAKAEEGSIIKTGDSAQSQA